jgi:hypothetical protein
MGGRRALSSDDHAKTTANFTIDKISCIDYPSVLPGKSMVCLSETGRREVNFAEVAHKDHLECMRSHVFRGTGDDPNPSKGYNVSDDLFNAGGSCGGEKTEVGFFRFDIHHAPRLNANLDHKLDAVTHDGFRPMPAVDLYNQPFTYATTELDVTHDSNGNKLPWDFHFGKMGGSMLKLDQTRDEHGDTRSTDGDRDGTKFTGDNEGLNTGSFNYVRGFSAGLTYFHNPGSWKEVPNLFNPFWRAKLSTPGANALKNLKAISTTDCQVGKELGYVNAADPGRENDCK